MREVLNRMLIDAAEKLGWQHPTVCLAEAALHFNSTEACNNRAMQRAIEMLEEEMP